MRRKVIGPRLGQVIEHCEMRQKCSLAAYKHPVMCRRHFLGRRNGLSKLPKSAARGKSKTVPHKFASRNSLRKEKRQHSHLFRAASGPRSCVRDDRSAKTKVPPGPKK